MDRTLEGLGGEFRDRAEDSVGLLIKQFMLV
jgi:hypothetical protein